MALAAVTLCGSQYVLFLRNCGEKWRVSQVPAWSFSVADLSHIQDYLGKEEE